ncbi:MAG: CRISPR-associated endonuclease Cas2 [Paramuribaculum sp.]|jgi:CRISPR-associated protein Cas2
MYILVTYDVDTTTDASGPKRLRKVAKACLDYGQRVQNSVFECELTEAQLCILKETIRGIIDATADSVRFYHLNKNENRRIEVLGVETSYKVDSAIVI